MIATSLTKRKPSPLPGLRKAAMLLIVLGEQASAEMLQQLDEEEVQTVSREVARITSISTEQAESRARRVPPDVDGARLRRSRAASTTPASC